MVLIVQCPHCNQYIEVIELNCRIFRCGVLKSDFSQINPHSSKEECVNMKNSDIIYGCGKPFRIFQDESHALKVEKCDYI